MWFGTVQKSSYNTSYNILQYCMHINAWPKMGKRLCQYLWYIATYSSITDCQIIAGYSWKLITLDCKWKDIEMNVIWFATHSSTTIKLSIGS